MENKTSTKRITQPAAKPFLAVSIMCRALLQNFSLLILKKTNYQFKEEEEKEVKQFLFDSCPEEMKEQLRIYTNWLKNMEVPENVIS